MEELLDKVNKLTAKVSRIETMIQEDREKKKCQDSLKEMAIKCITNAIIAVNTRIISELEKEGEEDPDKIVFIQGQINDYNKRIETLENNLTN